MRTGDQARRNDQGYGDMGIKWRWRGATAPCSLISVILPISFYLKLFWHDIPLRERLASWVLLALFSVMGLVGTVWTFLPKHLVGA